MKFNDHTLIALIGAVGLLLILASKHAKADTTTYYNQYGNTVVANTYNHGESNE